MVIPHSDIEKKFFHECRTRHPHPEVVAWLEQEMGPFGDRWYRFGTDIAGVLGWEPYDHYRFRRPEDAVLFSLKWS